MGDVPVPDTSSQGKRGLMPNPCVSTFRALHVKSDFHHKPATTLRGLSAPAILMLIITSFASAMSASDSSSSAKISTRLLSETANGGRAEALIVLTEQADLTAAASLKT